MVSIAVKKRLSPGESRAAALDAARQILIESGPQAVTLKAVAARVDRTHANLLHHFGSAAGLRRWVTSRDAAKGEAAVALGALHAFDSGARLPERVDAVMETVGAATWSHSVNSLRPGGRIVISGATSGDAPAKAELTKIFFKQLQVIGSTMGTRDELERLTKFVVAQGIQPKIDRVLPLAEAREGFAAMAAGQVDGKVVFTT